MGASNICRLVAQAADNEGFSPTIPNLTNPVIFGKGGPGLFPTNTLTALAGGGQTGATAMFAGVNRVTTVATIGDSVLLPPALAGAQCVVCNAALLGMDVFPTVGDIIDPLAANVAIRLFQQTNLTFFCAVKGTWNVEPFQLPAAQFATGTTTTTFTAGQLTGAIVTNYSNTGATPGSIATRTATQMFGDTPNAIVGQSYLLIITNAQGTGTLTVTAGTGVTLTGTATIAVNTWRAFIVTFNTATTLTIQNIATGTFS